MKDTYDRKAVFMRDVTLMAVQPGRADAPGIGNPIAIVTIAWRGEIEAPMMLSVRDAKALAFGLMGVLAHFGDKDAEKITEDYPGHDVALD